MGLLLVGFGFKVALVPFHMWTPDVYQGAPDAGDRVHVGGDEGRGVRGAASACWPPVEPDTPWLLALAVLAVLTMTAGQPGRAAPDQPQAYAGLLQHRARRLSC